ncbi:MAG: DUF418 domain-containing protein [Bacteroidales bacterium]|nr:DUF418 domain-containing protein [Bacteroidales bacterium]
MNNTALPVKNRIIALDALRGFALMGIAMANFPEFSLWTFLDGEAQRSMDTGGIIDTIVRSLQYMLIDGKFYTIFSVLFGIGFYIIISHAMQRGANGFKIFFRRMLLLLAIGIAHLLLIWSGDILALYAAIGLLLPLFRNCEPKTLLRWAAAFFLLPIVVEIWRTLSGIDPSVLLYNAWWSVATNYGITEQNFATWLRDANNYGDVHAFLMQGGVERMWEFVSGQRYFKVLALFLMGYYIGKQKIFSDLESNAGLLAKVSKIGFAIGIPISAAYTWSAMSGQPLGSIFHSIAYTLSVYPLGFAYMATFGLLYLRHKDGKIWQALAYPGRMALTCYISQSIIGVLLFYGIGLGFGTSIGLTLTEIISIAVFGIETILCAVWLKHFNFGPLEWIWRMLTYGKWMQMRKE